jgi:hypothetical protein
LSSYCTTLPRVRLPTWSRTASVPTGVGVAAATAIVAIVATSSDVTPQGDGVRFTIDPGNLRPGEKVYIITPTAPSARSA